jgi:hypothetical protein
MSSSFYHNENAIVVIKLVETSASSMFLWSSVAGSQERSLSLVSKSSNKRWELF